MSIYQKFYKETIDENGKLTDIQVNYPANFNFGYDVVDAVAAATPDKKALVWCNTEEEEHIFSFDDIRRKSNQAANALLKAGIRRGDRVMLALKRHYEYWFIAIALHKIGAVMIPVTHMLTTDDFIYRIGSAKVKAIICTHLNNVPDRVTRAVKHLNADCRLYTIQQDADGFENFSAAMAAMPEELERRETAATDPMVIYFTSGTSDYPKGVIHDYTYPLAHHVTAKYWQQVKDDGLHFTVSETGWAKASWGKLYGQWLNGCAVMVYDFDNFEPKQMAAIINRYGVTSFCAPPTIYRYLTRKGAPKMPSLESATTAGEFLSPEVFRRFQEHTGLELREGYGQTETTLLLANFKGMTARDGSLGMPSPFYNIALQNKDGSPTADGEIGEVVIIPKDGKRPLGVFCNYLDNKECYDRAWRNGVYHTGDAVWRDENGYYWFQGRFDDIIKSGGFRIGPYEIENILIKHPAVLECSIIGIPDPLRGQSIKAVIVLSPEYTASNDLNKEIREFCNSKLAEYKWVRLIEFADEMPKTISGKIRKAEQRKNSGNLPGFTAPKNQRVSQRA